LFSFFYPNVTGIKGCFLKGYYGVARRATLFPITSMWATSGKLQRARHHEEGAGIVIPQK